ncbi:MAG: glycoside hydrolase family 3 protein, partial [Idiomarina sp.]|nr:glycoside hydrolase family 3 protein [Idiomarina sp.]
DQGRLNGDEQPYQPLFELGYGLRFGDESEALNDLPTDYATTDGVGDVPIFERAPQSPWKLQLGNQQQVVDVTSSIQDVDALVTETFDDQVQEDARLFRFSGDELAYFTFVSPFPRDLRAFGNEQGALSVTLKSDSAVNGEVNLAMNCGAQGCQVNENISSYIPAGADKWTTLSFSVACLESAGLELAKVGEVLRISSAGANTLRIRDARLTSTEQTESLICLGE